MKLRAAIYATILMIAALIGASTTALAGNQQAVPTVTTDKSDYAPGDTANISGSGWYPNQSVTLQVVHSDGTAESGAGRLLRYRFCAALFAFEGRGLLFSRSKHARTHQYC